MALEDTAGYFVDKARSNIKKWGFQDYETLGLAIAEETGELAQAILKHKWEGGMEERILEEAEDLGALCFQVFCYYDQSVE